MEYVLDAARSRFTVQVFAGGLLSALGHSPIIAIGDFTGEFRFDPAKPAESSFNMTVKADSLTVTGSVSAKDRQEIEDRMRREALETAANPEIAFQSSEITAERIADDRYRLRIAGELRLHGVTKPLQVDAQLRLSGDEARLSGQFPLSQSAYRIKPVTALGGMIKLKDEVKVDFDLVARKKDG